MHSRKPAMHTLTDEIDLSSTSMTRSRIKATALTRAESTKHSCWKSKSKQAHHNQSRTIHSSKMTRTPYTQVFTLLTITCILVSQCTAQLPRVNGNYYHLKTKFLGDAYCLEVGTIDPHAPLQGAAHMAPCSSSDKQMWTFEPSGKRGWALLHTLALGATKCLVGKRFGGGPLGGAAFMDDCGNVAAMHWTIRRVKGYIKYFTMKTPFPAKHGECFEGNKVADGSTLDGAAFMSECAPFSGQMFYVVSVDVGTVTQ